MGRKPRTRLRTTDEHLNPHETHSIQECYEALTYAIALQAMDDYKKILLRYMDEKPRRRDGYNRRKLEAFFLGGDFERVTQTAVDPARVVERIKEEVAIIWSEIKAKRSTN